MPLKLILIRHCKSSWDAHAHDDHSRALNERGKRTAPLIGAWLAAQGHLPEMVLCSDAARTRETWGLISAVMTAAPQATYSRYLYLAPDLMMLEQIRKASGRVVALIGHNPGIAELADGLVSAPPDHDRFADYPTGATTVMTFDTGRWADLAEGTGQIVDFVVPRDLA